MSRLRAVIVDADGNITEQFTVVTVPEPYGGGFGVEREDGADIDLPAGHTLVIEAPLDPRDAAPFN